MIYFLWQFRELKNKKKSHLKQEGSWWTSIYRGRDFLKKFPNCFPAICFKLFSIAVFLVISIAKLVITSLLSRIKSIFSFLFLESSTNENLPKLLIFRLLLTWRMERITNTHQRLENRSKMCFPLHTSSPNYRFIPETSSTERKAFVSFSAFILLSPLMTGWRRFLETSSHCAQQISA